MFDQPVTIELMLNRLDCKCENKEGRAGNMRKYLDVSLFYIINLATSSTIGLCVGVVLSQYP